MIPDLLQKIDSQFNPARALEICAELCATDSRFTFSDFKKTSAAAVRWMKQAGLDEVEIHSFPADGKTRYGDWTVPRAWDVNKAVLTCFPGSSEIILADREKSLCSVIMYSAPTPGGKKVSCLLVSDTDYTRFKGNLVFTDDPEKISPELLAEHGALGIVTDFMPTWSNCRSRADVMDVTLWNNSYFAPANEFNLVGLQLTPAVGDNLRELLSRAAAPLKAEVQVDSRLYDGTMDFVTGVLPGDGSTDQEAAVFSHLFEPGANDNASGCAMAIEAVTVLSELVKNGVLPPLRRSIRLCFPLEIYSSLAYFEKFPDVKQRIIAGVNPDMVAPDLAKCKSRLHLCGTPASAPSFTEALLAAYISESAAGNHLFRWSEKKFFINDNIVTDPAIGIPSPVLVCLRDTFYHSDHDIMENLSAETMRIIGNALTSYLYELSRGELSTAEYLLNDITGREIKNLNSILLLKDIPLGDVLTFRVSNAHNRLESVREFILDDPDREIETRIAVARKAVSQFSSIMQNSFDRNIPSPEWAQLSDTDQSILDKAQTLIPRRITIGTLTMENWFTKKQLPANDVRWSYYHNAPLFWADGKRTVFEIWQNYCYEFLKPRSLAELLELFLFLEQEGHLALMPG